MGHYLNAFEELLVRRKKFAGMGDQIRAAASLNWGQDNPETDVEASDVREADAAAGATRVAAPTTAAAHAVGARPWSLWIRRTPRRAGRIPILTPLPSRIPSSVSPSAASHHCSAPTRPPIRNLPGSDPQANCPGIGSCLGGFTLR